MPGRRVITAACQTCPSLTYAAWINGFIAASRVISRVYWLGCAYEPNHLLTSNNWQSADPGRNVRFKLVYCIHFANFQVKLFMVKFDKLQGKT
jgi:hypothetical protein